MSIKIISLTVTDENGRKQTIKGEGYLSEPQTTSKKGEPYQQSVTAVIYMPARDIKGNV